MVASLPVIIKCFAPAAPIQTDSRVLARYRPEPKLWFNGRLPLPNGHKSSQRVHRLTHIFQAVQLILFILPILALLGIGLKILLAPISILNQRWYLAVFFPLLLANTLVIVENLFNNEVATAGDWRLLLIVIADFALLVGFVLYFRGILVYGMTLDAIEIALKSAFDQQGYETSVGHGEKKFLWERIRDARILSMEKAGHKEVLWLTERFKEVLIRADTRAGLALFQSVLPELRTVEQSYEIKDHATGVLYLMLAIIFAVLTWIFFFEPRFILIS